MNLEETIRKNINEAKFEFNIDDEIKRAKEVAERAKELKKKFDKNKKELDILFRDLLQQVTSSNVSNSGGHEGQKRESQLKKDAFSLHHSIGEFLAQLSKPKKLK